MMPERSVLWRLSVMRERHGREDSTAVWFVAPGLVAACCLATTKPAASTALHSRSPEPTRYIDDRSACSEDGNVVC